VSDPWWRLRPGLVQASPDPARDGSDSAQASRDPARDGSDSAQANGDLAAGPAAAADMANTSSQAVRLTAWVEGRVQGVGFRWWARSRALELGLVGQAENLADGRVKVVAEGPRQRCQELLELLQGASTPGRVRQVVSRWAAASGGLAGFSER
jgi:acylphosphatase